MTARNIITLLSFCALSFPLQAAPATAPSDHASARNVSPQEEELHARIRKFDEIQDKIRQLTQSIKHQTERYDVSAASLHEATSKLDQVIFDLQLENAGSKARVEAMLKEIQSQEARVEESIRLDPVIGQLQSLVDLDSKKYQALTMLQAKAADAGTAEVIHRGDRLQITIGELDPGKETVKTCEVREDGTISLPFIGKIAAGGSTEAALEKEIPKAYSHAGVAVHVQASVAVVARATDALNAAATELAEVKARLAVQQEHAISTAGGDLVPALRKQLVELTIAQKERDARLQFAFEQREAIAGGLADADKLQMLQSELKQLHAKIEEMESDMMRVPQ